MITPPFYGFIVPIATPPPTPSSLEFWVDGQPIAVTVTGDSMAYWVDGQPVEQDVD